MLILVFRFLRSSGFAAIVFMLCQPLMVAASSAMKAPVRTIASGALESPSAELLPDPKTELSPEQAATFNLASAGLLDDDDCVDDEPLRAGMNFEKQLDCQRQFQDMKTGH